MPEPNSATACGDIFITGSRLQVFDVSDPQNIQFLSSMDNNASGEAVAFLNDTTVLCAASRVFGSRGYQRSVQSDENGQIRDDRKPDGDYVDGNTAYISALGNGIQVVDFTDRNNPVLIETIHTLGDANACYLDGDRLDRSRQHRGRDDFRTDR